MSLKLGGEGIFIEQVNQQTQKDLYKADMIATPVSIVVLILVFGSVVAALVPLCLGGGCALIILTSLYFLGQFFNLSIFTLNIALLLGLCLSLDYALFIISRFRSELKKHPIHIAIAITEATAGRAVFFSGLAVFISLSALLLFPINILFSIGVGGLVAVFIAVSIALFLLPAVLSVLNQGINCLSIQTSSVKKSRWRQLGKKVLAYPVSFFAITLTLLVLLGMPFLNAKFGLSDYHILPERAESRSFFDAYHQAFNDNTLNPIQLILTTPEQSMPTQAVQRFIKRLKENPRISDIQEGIERPFKQGQKTTFTVINIISQYPANAPQTKALIQELREMNPGSKLHLELTGTPVKNDEVLATIQHIFPYAMLWIMGLTYLILLFLLRSLFLPLKAIAMNILSLSASYGVLVFIFQEGHLHELLNFDPQGLLDISLLIIIFCALFGFSMVYLRRYTINVESRKQSASSVLGFWVPKEPQGSFRF
ncbi:MAG: MMPL family transporter, partial [Legionellaceae bacterium]